MGMIDRGVQRVREGQTAALLAEAEQRLSEILGAFVLGGEPVGRPLVPAGEGVFDRPQEEAHEPEPEAEHGEGPVARGSAEGEGGVWSLVAFGGCIVTGAAILVALAILEVVAYRAPDIDAGVLSVLYDAACVANLMTASPNAVYTVAVAIVIYRTAVLPRWIGAGALLVAVIHLLSAMSLARAGAFSPMGVLPSVAPLSHTAWLATVAYVLLRR